MAGVRRESSSTRSRREVPRDSAQEPIRLFCCSAKNDEMSLFWERTKHFPLIALFRKSLFPVSFVCVERKIQTMLIVSGGGPHRVHMPHGGLPGDLDDPKSCVDLVWSSIFYFWKFHLILIVVTNLSKVVLTCCNAGSAGWLTIFTYTLYLKLVSMRAALIHDLPGWHTIFTFTCYFKARVNESNALLGWMIYYFVFWLLPMQVNIESIWPLWWFSRTWLKWYKVKSNLTLNWIISNLT